MSSASRTFWRPSTVSKSTSGRGRAAFDADELIQTWITHHLQIVGEASRGLSDEFQAEHPEIP